MSTSFSCLWAVWTSSSITWMFHANVKKKKKDKNTFKQVIKNGVGKWFVATFFRTLSHRRGAGFSIILISSWMSCLAVCVGLSRVSLYSFTNHNYCYAIYIRKQYYVYMVKLSRIMYRHNDRRDKIRGQNSSFCKFGAQCVRLEKIVIFQRLLECFAVGFTLSSLSRIQNEIRAKSKE